MSGLLSREFAKRFVALRAKKPFQIPAAARFLASESENGGQSSKKPGVSSLLSSLKGSKEGEVKNIAEQLKRDRVYSQDEITKNLDKDEPLRVEISARKAVLEANRKHVTDSDRKTKTSRLPRQPPRRTREDSERGSTRTVVRSKDFKHESWGKRRQEKVADTVTNAFESSDVKIKADPDLDSKLKSILSSLKVDTNRNQLSKDIIGAVQGWGKKPTRYRTDIIKDYNEQFKTRSKPVEQISLTSGNRLTLFDEVFSAKEFLVPPEKLFLTEQETLDGLVNMKMLDYRNDFESLIALADRQWKFPVDNEVCKVDEAIVGFEEHVFLGYLLDEFPKKGPVRQFMELVICGLEQNPHLSVSQKKDQVAWFKDYFEKIPKEELTF
ncbi:28S ribosomal protein S31, mitochondrial [Nematostella vectensis]|uniref:28S ribosomal protein S31, mitochondrial n=1 Tax=Nematostella vectensis TaxID=45351 RepID=UPI0020779625|nr:28S ribosomal protein S31, mitochondrial [Nematostella vectensis]